MNDENVEKKKELRTTCIQPQESTDKIESSCTYEHTHHYSKQPQYKQPELYTTCSLRTTCSYLLQQPYFSLFTILNSQSFKNIIYATQTIGFCYPNMITKIMSLEKRFAQIQLQRLSQKQILELIHKEEYIKAKVSLVQRYDNIPDYHFKLITFYRLKPSAKEFYDNIELKGIIEPDILKKVEYFGTELLKSHSQIEKERKKSKQVMEDLSKNETPAINFAAIEKEREQRRKEVS